MNIKIWSCAFAVVFINAAIRADDGVRIRVGPDIGVDAGGDGVDVRVGPLRIRIGDGAGRERVRNVPSDAGLDRFLSDLQLLDAPVVRGDNRPPGRVEDIVVDTLTGQVRYAAVTFPDVEQGRKLFAIPLNVMALELHGLNQVWRLELGDDTLAAAPGFLGDHWPNVASRQWAEEIDVYYGVVIQRGDFASDFGTDPKSLSDVIPLERFRRLVGISVLDTAGNSVGTIQRLIMDRSTATVRYLAITPIDNARRNRDGAQVVFAPIMAGQLAQSDDGPLFLLNVDAEQFARAPRFTLRRALEPGHSDWAGAADEFFATPNGDLQVPSAP